MTMPDLGPIRLKDLLELGAVLPALDVSDKHQAFEKILSALGEAHPELDTSSALASLEERERLGTTGVGDGVAIPHAKIDTPTILAALARAPEGIPFGALDGAPVRLLFVLLTPREDPALHLKALARVSRLLGNPSLREHLLAAEDASAILDAIEGAEKSL
jgi:PTS system nitrogen regulatory IIA component